MKQVFTKFVIVSVVSVLAVSCSKKHDGGEGYPGKPTVNAVVFSAAGDSAGIVNKLNEFRLFAGDPVNGNPGATTGRREVNWDGVPAALTNNNNFPFNFFGSAEAADANGRKRGLITTPTSTSFRVDSSDFASVDASYASQFEAFSRKKLFADMGNTITEVTFKVPGTNNNAFVKSFAVIFSDVDVANSTTVQYYNGTKSLGTFSAQVASQGFSLVGVGFADEKITRVKITSGNGLLVSGIKDISNGGNKDLVVMDDFLYSEPQPAQ